MNTQNAYTYVIAISQNRRSFDCSHSNMHIRHAIIELFVSDDGLVSDCQIKTNLKFYLKFHSR